MPRGRSPFRNWAEYGLVRAVLWTLAIAPLSAAHRLGLLYTHALDKAVPRLRRIALENLRFALPELSLGERNRLVDRVFDSAGRILVAFSRFPKINRDQVHNWIHCEGMEHVNRALDRGRGVIFATGHLGNWELSAFAFALLERPIHVVVRPLDNPLIDALTERYRTLSGNASINKRDYARGILQALSRNEMVGILADQHVQDGIPIEFFGRPASTSAGLTKIAAKTGAAVIPGFALWSATEQKYVLRFLPEVEIQGDPVADTQRVQSAIESVIREDPGQWLWIHRRWKQ